MKTTIPLCLKKSADIINAFKKDKSLVKNGAVLVFFFTCSMFTSCFCDNSKGETDRDKVSPLIFGANYDWIHLAAGTADYGDLIRDRSFRSRKDTVNKVQVWGTFTDTGGTVDFNTEDPGDTSPAGGKSYTGYAELSQGSAGFTGISQQLISGVSSGTGYKVTFSSYGAGSEGTIAVYLYNSTYSVLAHAEVTAENGAWKSHTVTLNPSSGEERPVLSIYLTSAGSVRIDEVRMFRSGSSPVVSSALKALIRDLGVKSLRWPGGTLADWFYWKDSIGTVISRGELRAYGYYETPALGLHEFLDLCEELDIEPLVQVNVLDSSINASDLVEYILGPSTSVQGGIRAANGRSAPWSVTYFEIGNEPSENYTGSSVSSTGSRYASLADAVISAMKIKAASLKRTISAGAISEPCFQLADWMVPGSSDILDMLYYWNSQVFSPSTGVKDADFTNGHFYSSRYYSSDPEMLFRMAMSGGALLAKTVDTKISAETALPLWLTEYHLVVEDSGIVQPDYLKDFQSGLAIADIMMSIISLDLDAACIYNLIDTNGFGIIIDPVTGALRPGGLVFRMFSVMAGEKILNVSTGNTDTYTVKNGNGNVPSGFTYPVISAIATENRETGKQRVMLINRAYSSDIKVRIELEGFTPGKADTYLYSNSSLAANNENDDNVTVTQGQLTVDESFDITIPAHSLMRIDFK